MSSDPTKLRRGFTTGACATAALKAALTQLWGSESLDHVRITLPKGEVPDFAIAALRSGSDWAEAEVIKDAGDDPDVTHGATIRVRVTPADSGVVFAAGEGVGTVTMPGLPLTVGEPAINPVPRKMMEEVVAECAAEFAQPPYITITVSVPGGEALALKTWNPRLGIKGGISILGTTGIVRPFSCSAWIASIHRGIDVARAAGRDHIIGCTGATSEAVLREMFDIDDVSSVDMGDFVGGMLKYVKKNPVQRVTIGGGIGKMTKLAQGARDLHSARSQVDFANLADVFGRADLASKTTALHVYETLGAPFADWVAQRAQQEAQSIVGDATRVDVVVIDRGGAVLAQCGA